MTDYDVVVIGAGNGGLTSALTLARAGKRVLMLERHNIPGGCATTFIRGRFEFEVALHQLSGMGTEERPGPLRALFGELGVMDSIQFVEMENLYRLVIPGELDITLGATREEAVSSLSNEFPEEADAIERFFGLVYDLCMDIVGAQFMKDPEASKEKYPTYFKYYLRDSESVLNEFFKDPLLKAVVSVYWPYMGQPPSKMPFSDLAILLWAYCEFKPYHVKGGSQAISSALLDAFYKAGGQAKFNCRAERIIVSDGKVKGVVTEDGDEIKTDYILSNAGSFNTYVDLIDRENVPEDQFRNLGANTVGISAVTLFIGFDAEPEELGIKETTNFICKSTDYEKAYSLFGTLDPPEATLFTCYDVSDPDFSPPGTCQAALVALVYADPWLSIPPTQYAEAKYRFAEAMLAMAEEVFPGCRERIEELEVATPLTHLRYLGQPRGAIYGFDRLGKNTNLFRSQTPAIEGLYFAGAWAESGGFQPTFESGASAAKAILKSLQGK